MNRSYNIIENINNDVIVSDYLESEKFATTKNSALIKSIALTSSIIVCGSVNAKSMIIEPVFFNDFDTNTTEIVKSQSDYLDFYIQKVNEFSTPLVQKEELIEEILSFKSLKENWDGYGAIPLEVKSASNSLNILNKLDFTCISKVNEIYPNTHGTVTVEFENKYTEKLHLEIGNESFAYFIELNEIGVSFYNDLSFSDENIKELIKNIRSI